MVGYQSDEDVTKSKKISANETRPEFSLMTNSNFYSTEQDILLGLNICICSITEYTIPCASEYKL